MESYTFSRTFLREEPIVTFRSEQLSSSGDNSISSFDVSGFPIESRLFIYIPTSIDRRIRDKIVAYISCSIEVMYQDRGVRAPFPSIEVDVSFDYNVFDVMFGFNLVDGTRLGIEKRLSRELIEDDSSQRFTYLAQHLLSILSEQRALVRNQDALLSSRELFFRHQEYPITWAHTDEPFRGMGWESPFIETREMAKKRKKRKEERKRAEKKAEKLLLSYLDKDQKRSFKKDKTFISYGNETSTPYRITHKTQINVIVLTDDLERSGKKLCAIPDETVPVSDHVLAQKLLIENNETLFLETADPWSDQMVDTGFTWSGTISLSD